MQPQQVGKELNGIPPRPNQPSGDQFTIGLSSRRWISHFSTLEAEMDCVVIQTPMQYFQWTGEAIGGPFEVSTLGLPPHVKKMMRDGPPMSLQMRPLFHQMLHHQLQRFARFCAIGSCAVERVRTLSFEGYPAPCHGTPTSTNPRLTD